MASLEYHRPSSPRSGHTRRITALLMLCFIADTCRMLRCSYPLARNPPLCDVIEDRYCKAKDVQPRQSLHFRLDREHIRSSCCIHLPPPFSSFLYHPACILAWLEKARSCAHGFMQILYFCSLSTSLQRSQWAAAASSSTPSKPS